jgi:hypothetical protein
MAKPRKMELYLAEAERFAETVKAYRAAAGGDEPAPTPTKPRRLPTAQYPSEIPGYPLNPSPPKEIPEYRTMETAQIVVRARKAKGRGLIEPIGPSELRKRDSVSRRRDGEVHQ